MSVGEWQKNRNVVSCYRYLVENQNVSNINLPACKNMEMGVTQMAQKQCAVNSKGLKAETFSGDSRNNDNKYLLLHELYNKCAPINVL